MKKYLNAELLDQVETWMNATGEFPEDEVQEVMDDLANVEYIVCDEDDWDDMVDNGEFYNSCVVFKKGDDIYLIPQDDIDGVSVFDFMDGRNKDSFIKLN